MTVFDDSTKAETAFEDYKKRFVKEDGTVDLDGLFKKSFHQEDHIGKLEDEQARFRDDLKGRSTVEDLIKELKAQKFSDGEQRQPNEVTKDTPSAIDLEAAMNTKLSEFEKRLAQKQNVDYVKNELTKVWGPDFSEKLRARAKELGESEAFLEDMAMNRPKTFLSLVSPRSEKVTDYVPPKNEIRTATASHTNLSTYADFEKIRKEDPTTYWSPSVQNKLYNAAKEAREKGVNFYQNN